jgi:hypothetical protein
MKPKPFVALLPPYYNYPGHNQDNGISGGIGIFFIKTLFRATSYYAGYEMNKHYCKLLKKPLKIFKEIME